MIGNFFLNLNSICFLNNNKDIHLIISSIQMPQTQLIHIYNLRGEKIKEINDNKLKNYFVDSFYDDKLSKNYIIISTNDDIRALEYNSNKIVQHYLPVKVKPSKVGYSEGPFYVIIKKCGNITKLIAGMKEYIVKIWNFHSVQLLN